MEVLEHCLEPERRRILDELGAPLRARRAASSSACRSKRGPACSASSSSAPSPAAGHGDYAHRERYSPLEMLRAVAGRARAARGLRWARRRRRRLPTTATRDSSGATCSGRSPSGSSIERRTFTPLPWAALNSQVWFVCQSLSRTWWVRLRRIQIGRACNPSGCGTGSAAARANGADRRPAGPAAPRADSAAASALPRSARTTRSAAAGGRASAAAGPAAARSTPSASASVATTPMPRLVA